jgi:hypothetical protein
MKLEKKDIGKALKQELCKGYNIDMISDWAFDMWIRLPKESSEEVHTILDRISVMAAGPEFEYTEEELKLLANLLINEEPDPIEKIDDIKFKGV